MEIVHVSCVNPVWRYCFRVGQYLMACNNSEVTKVFGLELCPSLVLGQQDRSLVGRVYPLQVVTGSSSTHYQLKDTGTIRLIGNHTHSCPIRE